MNKILLSARDLKIGGIEKALINLINYLIANNYDVTLILEEKKGELLDEISDKVKIVCYTPSRFKIVNLFNRLGFLFKYYNKFDTSISFATYLKSGSFVARMASKNSILWCHADYLSLFDGNKSKVKEFFEKLYYDYFSKIVFVSKQAQKTFLSVFPEQKNTYYCNNLIDYNKIYKQSEEKINIKYDPNIVTFLNVGRHDEKQKKLTRIIGAAKKLKNRNYEFRIIFVGDGKDTKKYKKIVNKNNLQDKIIFVGKKENPYPYYKISNCVVLSSDYEGYPVVFLESYILNKPIITTNISDFEDIQNGRGIVTTKNIEGIYKSMEKFINNGYYIINPFNVREYNKNVENTLESILSRKEYRNEI